MITYWRPGQIILTSNGKLQHSRDLPIYVIMDVFVNMDDIEVFCDAIQKRTAHFKWKNAISIKSTESSPQQLTVCVAVVSSAVKLFQIFSLRPQPGGRIDLTLPSILRPNTFVCC